MNTYFAVSKREFNGLLALVLLIVGIAAVPYVYEILEPEEPVPGVPAILVVPQNNRKKPHYAGKKKLVGTKIGYRLFFFDPNTIGAEDWQRLGLSARQSATILNYRTKGGKFRKAEDLQKMYTISQEAYKRLLPYVKIAPGPEKSGFRLKTTYPAKPDYRPVFNIIELNEADSVALIEIKGVGPVFARRILKYRERLGGFYKKEQLMEVFGLDSVKFNEIKYQISLDTLNLRTIPVNAAVIDDFKGHPYIRYKQANALIQYRNQHGNYTAIADLSKVLILDAETIKRIAPYLNFKQ